MVLCVQENSYAHELSCTIKTSYMQFHEAMASWLGGRLLFPTNHRAWYRSLKEFDWIEQSTGHEAMSVNPYNT